MIIDAHAELNMTKPNPPNTPTDVRAAAHPSPTNWEKCDFSIVGADRLTCVYRFGGNSPGEHAAIWEPNIVERLKTSECKQICEVLETRPAGRDGRLPFIRMQHDDRARWLDELLRNQGPRPTLKQRVSVLLDVLTGVAYLHSYRLVHRELDLLAILVTMDGSSVQAKLTNFASLARLDADSTQVDDAAAEFPYATGEKTLDTKRDLRALGFVASQLLTWTYSGTYPDARTYDAAISAAIGRVETEFARTEHAQLVTIVSNLLGRNGEISTAGEAIKRLSAVVPRAPQVSRIRTWPVLAGLALVTSASLVFAFGPQRQNDPQPHRGESVSRAGGGAGTGGAAGSGGAADGGAVEEPNRVIAKESDRLQGELWVSENELVGYLTGLCSSDRARWPKPAGDRCSVDASDIVWQAGENKECLQALIMEENCKALEDKSHPRMIVPFIGIFTTLPPRSYDSLFDQLLGLYIVQKHVNAVPYGDYPKIIIPIGNGGSQQTHADEVVQAMLRRDLPVASLFGFADSRGGSERAIKLACQAGGHLTVTPTLSATELSKIDCFVSMVPMNRTEANVFSSYAKQAGFKTATLYKSYGPGGKPSDDDLYINSLAKEVVETFKAIGINVLVKDFKVTGLDEHACPVGDHLVISNGRYTDYPLFLHQLIMDCPGQFDPNNVVANDSASRIKLKKRDRTLQALPIAQLQERWIKKHKNLDPDKRLATLLDDPLAHELMRRIPVAVKSFELNSQTKSVAAAPLQTPDRCPRTLANAGLCKELGEHREVIPRDALLSATALQLLYAAAMNITPRAAPGQYITSDQLRPSFEKELLIDDVHDEPSDPKLALSADFWRLMTAKHDQKFARQDGHLMPLHSPISLVQRTAPGDDKVLCGCAHLDSEKSEPYCACLPRKAR